MAEREKLHELSARYRRRFGFPCLIALQPLGRGQVIRTSGTTAAQQRSRRIAENLRQLGLIASYRLQRRCTPPAGACRHAQCVGQGLRSTGNDLLSEPAALGRVMGAIVPQQVVGNGRQIQRYRADSPTARSSRSARRSAPAQ